VRSEGFYINEKSSDTSWDRASDLPICSTAPYPLCYSGPQFRNVYAENSLGPACLKLQTPFYANDPYTLCASEQWVALWAPDFLSPAVFSGEWLNDSP